MSRLPSSALVEDGYQQLLAALGAARAALLSHPVYGAVADLPRLRIFMRSHVFAVWDFMSLLKTLQRRLTCVTAPWFPPEDRVAARLINEIVLAEESDELAPGVFASHFELYIEAMDELGADAGPVLALLTGLRAGEPVEVVLARLAVPEQTRRFVATTLATCARPVEEVAASFLLGREDLIPDMFERLLPALPAGRLRLYVERHIALDGDSHGPLGAQLLRRLCGEDPDRWAAATARARQAIAARHALWDGVVQAIGGV